MSQRILLTLALVAALLATGLVIGMLRSREQGQRAATDAGAARGVGKQLALGTRHARRPSPAVHAPNQSSSMTRYNELKTRLQSASEARQAVEKSSLVASEIDEAGRRMPVGSLHKDYIARQMQGILPLVKECYDMALEAEPELAGKVVVRWTIIGEPEIGGLVESSEVLPELSDMTSPDFVRCVQESIYAIELEAPEGGGTVTVNYPMIFANSGQPRF